MNPAAVPPAGQEGTAPRHSSSAMERAAGSPNPLRLGRGDQRSVPGRQASDSDGRRERVRADDGGTREATREADCDQPVMAPA